MADTAIAITAGAGTNVDTRTEGTNGNHRQVVVIGDPATNAGVAPVDVTNGLSVNVTNASLTVGAHNVTNAGTFAVQAAQSTAANLNATVVGNGTFATQVTSLPTLPSGTNNIGDVDVLTINGQAPAFGSGTTGATVLRTTLATDSAGIISTGTAGSAASQVLSVQGIASMTPILATTTPAASEIHVGEVGGKTTCFSLTLSLDTSAYASGDVLADTQQCDAFFRKTDGTGVVQSLTVIDEDDQGAAFDVYFFQANRSLGTENSAPNISDANARDILGYVSVATTDYKDLGGVRIACIKGINLPVKAVSGTDDLYVGVVNGTGTPTYTATGMRLIIGGLLD